MRKIFLPSAVFVLATLIVVSAWYFTRAGNSGYQQPGTVSETTSQPEKLVVEELRTRVEIEDDNPKTKENESFDPFTPEYTIHNLDCQMFTGEGAASDVAIVTHQTAEGIVFAVIGEAGELARGELDFRPNHVRIGRRGDGSVVYGFGDLRTHARGLRPEDSPAPVRFYHDEFVIYESSKTLDFDVARDGSSFVVHELLTSDETRLVVRNLTQGTQMEHELNTKLTHKGRYSMGYTTDGTEVVFSPANTSGQGVYWFYSLYGERMRRMTVEGFWSALVTSSENGYFVERVYEADSDASKEVWEVSRRRIPHTIGQQEELWNVSLSIEDLGRRLSVSENGKWLGLFASDYTVLDTETGETIFDFPYRRNPEMQLARLAPILPADATVTDIGKHSSMNFKGNHLIGFRVWGDSSSCHSELDDHYFNPKKRECIWDLRMRGVYKYFYDIYDMNTVNQDGSPAYTAEVFPESDCVRASARWKGLVDVDGELAFQPVPPIEAVVMP